MSLFFKDRAVIPEFNVDQYSGLFTASTLVPAIFPDYDWSAFPVSEKEALATPAVYRALALYLSLGSRLKFKNAPEWLNKSYGALTPQYRLSRTIADLIFYSQSLWFVERNGAGEIVYAEHMARNRWTTTPSGHIEIDKVPVDDDSVIFFLGLMPLGLLDAARNSIRQYTSVSRTVTNRSDVPAPLMLIKSTDNFIGTSDEIAQMITDIQDVLENRAGGIVYVPQGLELEMVEPSDAVNSMLLPAREALAVDVANFFSLPASILNSPTSSDIYVNALQQKNEILEFSLRTYLDPIADRLGLEFDFSEFDAVDTAAGNLLPRKENE